MSGSWRSSAAGRRQPEQRGRPVDAIGDGHVPVRAVPGGDAMAPPQLAADVPVVDVLHPVEEGLLEALRHDARAPLAHGRHGPRGHGLDVDEPLRLEAWLDGVIAALATAQHQLVDAHLDEVAAGVEVGHDAGTGILEAETRVGPAGRADVAVIGHHVDGGQPVALTGGEVIVVVGRRDLDRAAAECRLHHGVGDDRHDALHEGDAHLLADQLAVAGIVGVDGHAAVAEDGLGPRGRHRDALPGHRVAVGVDDVVAHEPQRAHLRGGDDLQVRQAGPAARAPVDESFAAIGKAVVVEALEGRSHRLRRDLVHGEALAPPVGRRAEALLLALDDRPRLGDEPPHPLEVALAPQRLAALALAGEDAVEHELRRDRGVVHARQPQRRAALHARAPDHQVLGRGARGVAQVQRAGDIGRRLDDDERLLRGRRTRACAIRSEDVRRQPACLHGGLHLGRLVGAGHAAARRPGAALRLCCRSRSSMALPGGRRPLAGCPRIERPARRADERGRGPACWSGRGRQPPGRRRGPGV